MRLPKPKVIIRDLEVENRILSAMRDRVGIDKPRPGVHLSSLIHCLRKEWHLYRLDAQPGGRVAVLGPTSDKQALVWAIGRSHEDIFGTTALHSDERERDGIHYNVDYWLPDADMFCLSEMKSTRRSARKTMEDMEDYTAQVGGYAAAESLTEVLVHVLHIQGDYGHDHPPEADFHVWRLTFTKAELKAWWAELKRRRDILIGVIEPVLSLEADVSPAYDWECGFCPVRDLIGCVGCDAYQHEQELAANRERRKKQVQSLG